MRLLISLLATMALLTAGCTAATRSVKTPSRGLTFLDTLSPKTTFHWTVAQNGNGAIDGWLDGVDCMTETKCVAVGNESTSGGGGANALVETWNGSAWSHLIPPTATAVPADWLFSVSCATAGSCVAVGYYITLRDGGAANMLIETLAQGVWSVSPAPSPGGGIADSFLNGVSCTSPTSCVAVGFTLSTRFAPRPLIVALANGSWSIVPGPSLGPRAAGLQAVSCLQGDSCEAVGYQASGSADETLVESSHGGRWAITPSSGSGPTGLDHAGLEDVSCLTAASCVAVGRVKGPVPTIEVGNDQGWSIMTGPDPNPDDAATGLYGISCADTTSCVAVGDLAAAPKASAKNTPDGAFASPSGPLIETSSRGTWTIGSSPGLSPGGGLHAVSCSGRTCVAVGQASQSDVTKTLIVQSVSPGAT
jgi:hypothetical protein